MDIKYSQGIKAGIIGGVLIAILLIIGMLLNVLGSWTSSIISLCTCLNPIIEVIILLITGALAVHFAKGLLKDMNDALVTSAVAGGVAGLIGGGVAMIVNLVSPFLLGTTYGYEDIGTSLGLAGATSLGSGLCTCLCIPVWLLLGVFFGAIGGAIYFAVAGKK